MSLLGTYTLPDLLTAWLHLRRERRLAEADTWERMAMQTHLDALTRGVSKDSLPAVRRQLRALSDRAAALRRPEVPMARTKPLTDAQRLMIYGPDALATDEEGTG